MSSARPKDAPGLTVVDGAMLGAGMLAVSGAAMFYRAKKTTPFKIAYFMSWPLLGGAVIRVFGPKRQEMEQELKQRGLDQVTLQTSRQQVEAQLAALKGIAEEGKESTRWPGDSGETR